jgi:large subunit ribosomal protein L12
MEYVYSAMLLHSAGKKITEENIKKVLTAAGVKADSARIKALTASLEGVNIDEAIQTAAVPVAAAPAAAAPSGDASAPAEGKPEEKKEEKKKEKKEEVSEEEAAAGLGALFG